MKKKIKSNPFNEFNEKVLSGGDYAYVYDKEDSSFKEAELIVSLKQGGIFSSNCCFANFGNAMFLGLNEFLDATGQPGCI